MLRARAFGRGHRKPSRDSITCGQETRLQATGNGKDVFWHSWQLGREAERAWEAVQICAPKIGLGKFDHDLNQRPKPIDDGECKVN